MTTFYEEFVECGVCGSASPQEILGSFSTTGPPDLDLRQNSPGFDPIHFMIQRCSFCGYCSRDLSDGTTALKEIIEGAAYQEQLNNADYPEMGNSYLCSAMIQEKTGRLPEAAWDIIHAAWICDDEGKEEQAKACRIKALKLITGLEEDETLTQDKMTDLCVHADLLRRAGRFNRAAELVEEGLVRSDDEMLVKILLFEETLIKKRDAGRHRVGEVG
jgi:ferredoxin